MTKRNALFLIVACSLGLGLGMLAGASYITDDPATVQLIQQLMVPIGIAAAVALGVAFAAYTITETSARTAQRTTMLTTGGFLVVAALFGWFFWESDWWVAAALAAIALGFAALSSHYGRGGPVPPRWVRYVLVAGAFVAGALPGLVLYFILATVVSERYCQLTSSKCL
jgi:hypothetical protein